MRKVDQTTSAGVHETTTYVCGQGGRRTLRKTVNHTTNTAERVIDFAGLAEIRPDAQNGPTLLVLLTVAESTVFEDARNLSTGVRIKARSMYLHKDLRGSVLAQTPFDGAQIQPATSQDHDAWGQDIAVDGLPAPEHAFVDHEPDPGLGYYHFGAWVHDPSLRRWLSPDPLLMMLPGVDTATGVELNLYAYARNVVGRQVTVEMPSGKRTRPDTLTSTGAGLKVREAKNGPFARLTPNQAELQLTIETGKQVIPRGGNASAAGLTPGKPITIDCFQVDTF